MEERTRQERAELSKGLDSDVGLVLGRDAPDVRDIENHAAVFGSRVHGEKLQPPCLASVSLVVQALVFVCPPGTAPTGSWISPGVSRASPVHRRDDLTVRGGCHLGGWLDRPARSAHGEVPDQPNSEALIEHAANLGDLSEAILATVSVVHGELLGEPSAELRAKLAGSEVPSLFTPYQSM
jgi:hypothetical protein